MMRSISRACRAMAKKFRVSDKGNVAMIYALALLPSLAAVGSAVDLTRAMVVKMRLGEALDAAGLAVGAELIAQGLEVALGHGGCAVSVHVVGVQREEAVFIGSIPNFTSIGYFLYPILSAEIIRIKSVNQLRI